MNSKFLGNNKLQHLSFILFLIFFSFGEVNAQSFFDKLENWMLSRRVQITYGTQFAWYKNSHIHFIQAEYNRDLIFEHVQAKDNPLLRFAGQGHFGVNQFRINVGIEISDKYSIHLITKHLNYIVRTDREYYRNGKWNGIRISDTIDFSNYFRKLEHSNGINTWNIGLRRSFEIIGDDSSKVNVNLGITPQLGAILTATQADIINPNGIFEHYDPGNSLAGFNYALELSCDMVLFKHFLIGVNYNYFQMIIKGAKLHAESQVNQKLRGANYGISIGYVF